MAYSNYRRSFRARKNSSSDGFFGVLVVLAILAYDSQINLDRAPFYAVITGLSVLGLIVTANLTKRIARRNHIAADVATMSGLQFEKYVAKWLKEHGYTHIRLTERYDLGVDIIARKGGIVWGVQVKRRNGMVGADAVRQVVAALRYYHCERAMVITNGTYSRPAIELARSNDCELVSLQNS